MKKIFKINKPKETIYEETINRYKATQERKKRILVKDEAELEELYPLYPAKKVMQDMYTKKRQAMIKEMQMTRTPNEMLLVGILLVIGILISL